MSTGPPTTGAADLAGTDQPARCAEIPNWSTGPKTAAPQSTDALYLVRTGKHDCYDRVVFDINGSADAGYSVRYVPVVTADGSGEPIPVPGTAALQVVVHAPAQGFDNAGHQPGVFLAKTGDYFYTESQLAGWSSLRAVRFAGSFEGQSTIAIGVSTTLPFQVSTQLDPTSQIRRVVVDIAHEL
jgi:hypothetical protein